MESYLYARLRLVQNQKTSNETYDFVPKNYYRLRFSSAVATAIKEAGHNPKRVQ